MKPEHILKKLSEQNDNDEEIVTSYNIVLFDTDIEAIKQYAKQDEDSKNIKQ